MSFWKPASVSRYDDDELQEEGGGGFGDGGAGAASMYASFAAASSSSPAAAVGKRSRPGAASQQQPPSSAADFSIARQRLLLPIYRHRNQICYAVENYDVVVIVGETGCGKSTQLPQYLASDPQPGWASNDFCIAVTQPRRIAATTLASRVAQETNTALGGKVGYCVRFQSNFADGVTQIKYLTDGMLLREATASDPLLSSYSVVVVDEAHERSLNSDAVLGLLKKVRRKRRDLKIVVCSATIDAQSFVDFFVRGSTSKRKREDNTDDDDDDDDNNNTHKNKSDNKNNGDSCRDLKATIISVDGRQYPVDILYLARPVKNYVVCAVETAYKIIVQSQQQQQQRGIGGGGGGGDILCFLPSGEDIDRAIKIAEEEYFDELTSVDLLPLYGNLPYHMQVRVFDTNRPTAKNYRRVIFATNIAETSVTVPNISCVVDTGLVKLPYYDPRTGLERLIVCPTSQASAKQRAGRAGRVRSGICYRLYCESFCEKQMQAQTPPEILRTNLTGFILNLKALGVDNILAFDLMDVPSVDALSHGLETLYALGAIDENTRLTDLGLDMASFPTDPRVSRMLLESLPSGCSWEVLAVASALQVRDLFYKPRSSRHHQNQQLLLDYEAAVSDIVDPSGDHVTYANLLAEMDDHDYNQQECKERFINYLALKRAMEVRKQLASVLRKFGKIQAMGYIEDGTNSRSRAIRRCVTAGFFVNVAKLANDGRYYTLRKNVLVTPSSSSVFAMSSAAKPAPGPITETKVSEYIVFGETLDGPRGGIELKSVSSIEARWLRELAPNYWE